jgi:hypothetical protein
MRATGPGTGPARLAAPASRLIQPAAGIIPRAAGFVPCAASVLLEPFGVLFRLPPKVFRFLAGFARLLQRFLDVIP